MGKILIISVLSLVFSGLNLSAKTLSDTCGEDFELQGEANRILAYWHANNNQLLLMLGGAQRSFVTSDEVAKNELFYKIYPNLKILNFKLSGGAPQIEELLNLNPDIVITAPKFKSELKRHGFKAVCATYNSFKTMRDALNLTAQIIGGEAPAKAQRYLAYLDRNIKIVSERISKIPQQNRPKVLHIAKSSNLTLADGISSIVDEWIKLAGGVNAVQARRGNLINLNVEEIINIDPDVIIVGTSGEFGITAQEALERVYGDAAFSGLSAVKQHRVYVNPLGVFNWDRYSAEVALQVLWAAKTLHPQLFEDIDIKAEARAFYKEFMNYELSERELEIIFEGI